MFKLYSCTEAGGILNKTKQEVRVLVEKGILTNYGNSHRYIVSEKEVKQLLKNEYKLFC